MTYEDHAVYILRLIVQGEKPEVIRYSLNNMWCEAEMNGRLDGMQSMAETLRRTLDRI